MWNSIYKGIVGVFILFWVVFIFLDYWQNHLQYVIAFSFFKYLDLTIVLAVLGVGLVGIVTRAKKKSGTLSTWLNGLTIFLLGIIIILISVYLFQRRVMNVKIPVLIDLLRLVLNVSLLAFYTYFIVVACHAVGMYAIGIFRFHIRQAARPIIAIVTGIMAWVAVMFVLGLFGGLKWYILLPMMLTVMLLTRKETFPFVWQTLFKPLPINHQLRPLGIISFYILLIVISLNLLQITIPIPRGWDSVSLYLNLSSLINDYSGLVQGHQPYNWSIFMSLGFILFGKTEVALSLSFLGGILSLHAMYYLCTKWLNINVNYAFLCLLIFYLMPAIGHQSYLDLKVDLGLLFVLLTIVVLLVEWQNKLATDSGTPTGSHGFIILMGLLTGFAFGVKLTAVMAFFAVAGLIWFVYSGHLAFLAVFCMTVFAILLVKLDDVPKLRQFHLSAETCMFIMLGLGLLLFAWTAFKKRHQFIQPMKLSILYGVFFVLPILPWLAKNYNETGGVLSMQGLLYGKARTPNATIKYFDKQWRNTYKTPKKKKNKNKNKRKKRNQKQKK